VVESEGGGGEGGGHRPFLEVVFEGLRGSPEGEGRMGDILCQTFFTSLPQDMIYAMILLKA
jgi:hypothetical protein